MREDLTGNLATVQGSPSVKGPVCSPQVPPGVSNGFSTYREVGTGLAGPLAEAGSTPVVGLLLPAKDLPAGHNSDLGQGLGRERLGRPGQEVHSPAGKAVKSHHALSSASRWGRWSVLRC